MNAERIRDLQRQLQERETEELVNIWQTNDRQTWTPEAFEAIRAILLDRLGSLPPQNAPTTQETVLPENESPADTYHNFARLVRIASWAALLSKAFLVLGTLIGLAGVATTFIGEASRFAGFDPLAFFASLLNVLLIACISLFFFVLLQATAEGIYLLMDIEENTRPSPPAGKNKT